MGEAPTMHLVQGRRHLSSSCGAFSLLCHADFLVWESSNPPWGLHQDALPPRSPAFVPAAFDGAR